MKKSSVILSEAKDLVSVPFAARFFALRAQNDINFVIPSAARNLVSMRTQGGYFTLRAQNDMGEMLNV